jgi:hypothetical protein
MLLFFFIFFVGSSDVLSQKFKSKPGVTNVAVDNPLCDITNVRSRSGSRGKSSDLDKDVIYLDNDNVIVPDSVSPSPFRHRSRLAYSKVIFYNLLLIFSLF